MPPSQSKTIHIIVATRPNFMKAAPLYHELLRRSWASPILVHTGQHYDVNMSDIFFQDLGMPAPHRHLGVGKGGHASQTGRVMMAYEELLLSERPDLTVVVGDVNSTMACTLAASKIPSPVAHLEAGLRSFDRSMPEEINRIVTDALAAPLWTPSPDADENLLREGIAPERIQRVGNIMIDSLEMMRPKFEERPPTHAQYGLAADAFGIATLHRPFNVDEPERLRLLCSSLQQIARDTPVFFPVHPRTRNRIQESGLANELATSPGLILTPPLGYLEFMSLVIHCAFVITDSGGIQEETTYLGTPCVTVRPNTERPVTVEQGTNTLCEPEDLVQALENSFSKARIRSPLPKMWDGKTAPRVADSIHAFLQDS